MVPIVIHPGNYPSGYQWCEACELALTRPRTTQALQKAQGELTVLRLPDNSDNSKPSKRPHSAHVAVSWACAGEKLERSWLHVSSSLNCGKMAALEQLLQDLARRARQQGQAMRPALRGCYRQRSPNCLRRRKLQRKGELLQDPVSQ